MTGPAAFNSPTWDFSAATFNTTAAAFDNPDYVSIRRPGIPRSAIPR